MTIDTPEFQRLLNDCTTLGVDAHACGGDFGTIEKYEAAEVALVAHLNAELDKWKKTVSQYDQWLSAGVYFTTEEYAAECGRRRQELAACEQDALRYRALFEDTRNPLYVVRFQEADDPIVYSKAEADELIDGSLK